MTVRCLISQQALMWQVWIRQTLPVWTQVVNLTTTNPDNPTLDSQATTQGEQAHLADKAFIIKADVNFAVKDVAATKDQLESLALQTGGYIQTSKIYNNTTDTHRYPIGASS